MSEKEKRIIEKLKDAIPNMSEFDKGYILGKTESFSENKPVFLPCTVLQLDYPAL
jgi:hypothetical protein